MEIKKREATQLEYRYPPNDTKTKHRQCNTNPKLQHRTTPRTPTKFMAEVKSSGKTNIWNFELNKGNLGKPKQERGAKPP